MTENPIRLRQATESDWPLILDSWWRSYQDYAVPLPRDLDEPARLSMAAFDVQAKSEGLPTSEELHRARAESYAALRRRYMLAHRAAIEAALRRGHAVLATFTEDSDTVLGWVVFEGPADARVVHFVYVKNDSRRCGVATYLLESVLANGATSTHRTTSVAEALARKFGLRYAPGRFAS